MPFALLLVLIFVVISWLSIHLLEKRNIIRSWLTPSTQRLKEFTLGFIIMGLLCLISQLFFSVITDISWSVSDEITIPKFISATLTDINGVLNEELAFRGVIFMPIHMALLSRINGPWNLPPPTLPISIWTNHLAGSEIYGWMYQILLSKKFNPAILL